jgi:hypothetical protein
MGNEGGGRVRLGDGSEAGRVDKSNDRWQVMCKARGVTSLGGERAGLLYRGHSMGG